MRTASAIENWFDRAKRHNVELTAEAVRPDGSSLAVKLANISYDGCLLEADTAFSIGEKITLALPRLGEMKAQVRWATGDGKAGARFLVDENLTMASSRNGL